MKLRNKETGEIMQLSVKCKNGGELRTFDMKTNIDKPITLAELNKEWEDMPEEPKTFWAISWAGEPEEYDAKRTPQELKYMAKQIGNYFETKEEAEKAVEKLKAWKRLEDGGFRFLPEASFIQKNDEGESIGYISFTMDDEGDYIWGDNKDLKVLFGGEDV